MAITLSDDGTFDTVLRCDECGEEFRFNWDGAPSDDDNADELACIAEVESEHECQPMRRKTFQIADDAWSAELHRLFGKRAGDVRYTAQGTGDAGSELRRLHDAFVAAGNAWRAGM